MEAERQLYEELRQSPDFHLLPLPQHWYEKFGIPRRTMDTTREFLESGYTMKCMYAQKDLPPLIIDEPIDNGRQPIFHIVEEVPLEIISRPFEQGKHFPAVLPSLTDDGLASVLAIQSLHHETSSPHLETLADPQHDPDETSQQQVDQQT